MSNIRTYEITHSEPKTFPIQQKDSTDYLLGGCLVMKNGRIDKYQFEEGYCLARKAGDKDYFTFCYYDKDHLGNIRQVTQDYNGISNGKVIQTMNYYPFGAEFCDNRAKSFVQNHKYNGKEFDHMHGLNTYDYGARQYNPVTARWDRMDPHCESYYNVSPYVYANNNPVMLIDLDGRDWYSSLDSVGCNKNGNTIWKTQIHYTDCTSQEQLANNNVNGTYFGKTVVLFDGYYDEKLGKGGIIDGPGSKHATATVYGANGPDDITSYTAFTMSSNFEKYGAIQDGIYDGSWRAWKGSGSIPKHYMLEGGTGAINTIDGNRNKGGYNEYQKNEIFIHATWNKGKASGNVSKGCLLIKDQQMADFEKHVGKKPFKVILRRQ